MKPVQFGKWRVISSPPENLTRTNVGLMAICVSFTLGLRGGRDSRPASAAVSHRAHALGRWRHAVPNEEVLGRLGPGARHSVHHPWVSRCVLRAAYREFVRAVLLGCAFRSDRVLSGGRTVRPARVQTRTEIRRSRKSPPSVPSSSPGGLIFRRGYQFLSVAERRGDCG